MTSFHTAAANATKASRPFQHLLLLASKSHELDIPDLMGRSPLFYAARKLNFETVEELLKNGASPHLLDYAGWMLMEILTSRQNCVEFASMFISTGNENKNKKQLMISRLIEAMKTTPVSPEVTQINDAIRDMRLHHPFSPFAAELGHYSY